VVPPGESEGSGERHGYNVYDILSSREGSGEVDNAMDNSDIPNSLFYRNVLLNTSNSALGDAETDTGKAEVEGVRRQRHPASSGRRSVAMKLFVKIPDSGITLGGLCILFFRRLHLIRNNHITMIMHAT